MNDGYELKRTDAKGEGVFATRSFQVGETVMVGVIDREVDHNHSHASQIGEKRFVLHGGLVGFRPERLWVGSANGTHRSRSSLEFGMWLDDPQALQAAEAFLVQLMAHSEALDPDSDLFEPELLPVDFDDEALADYLAEYSPEWDKTDT
ncbi:hypothetical protein [Streptomyces sp. NPDC058424]|uniref:hypothetical protein n=1 Tax=Streptomyces sp. NPDC058424 TaxID=3346491 RepID=UPI0036511B70